VIYKFLLKASKANLGVQDNDFRNELREIANVICTILGNKTYHPEVKDDDHLALYIQNFWFSLIMVVMNTDGLWPQSWRSVIQLLAEKSLPLVLPPSAKTVEAHLASCAAFQLSIPDSV
jgi:hypothetical protein